MLNMMSVDLEDYYSKLPFSEWDKHESTLIKPTKKILELFDKYEIKATFFTLGYVAERHPELIKEIKSKGHEIASHSYSHPNLNDITQEIFEEDFLKSLSCLKDITGEKVRGFRTPFFSIKNNEWAFDIMKKHLDYDSSVSPVKLRYGSLNGVSEAPIEYYHMSADNPYTKDEKEQFLEIPVTTLNTPIGRLPMGGGFYLRFFPTWMLKRAILQMNKKNLPSIFYIHPPDLQPDVPRIPDYRWYSYYGLKNAVAKFEEILKSFKFSSVEDVLLNST